MGTGLFVLFVVVAIAGFVLTRWLKEQRRKAFAVVAGRLGLLYSADDPFGLVDLPFELFNRGDGRGVENVLHGSWHDADVRVFDYWYFENHTDAQGNHSRDYRRFSAAVRTLPLRAPHTRIAPETLLTRLADAIGLDDIDFESEEFNRRMQVTSSDRRFASYLIDARMMQWLLEDDRGAFELHGPHVLIYGRQRSPAELETLLGSLRTFESHVPRAVLDVYGAPR